MITWDESLSTGYPKLDEQHKTLFGFLNDLDERIREGRINASMRYNLDFLYQYARLHFGFEEKCMHRYRCPVGEQNKKAHQSFLDYLDLYEVRVLEEGITAKNLASLHLFIEQWITSHILKIDTRLKPCISKNKQ